MDSEADIENEDQFWDELDDVVCTPCRTQDRIDDTLRTWLALVSTYRESYAHSEELLRRCSLALFTSDLFKRNDTYIRRQLVECLLSEDDSTAIHLVVVFLLHDGRENEETHVLMNEEGAFGRLVGMIKERLDDDAGLHRLLFELLYEMSRMQQLATSQLLTVDDSFILYVLQIIESLSNDVYDPYHYPTMRVLLVLNEQYMIASQGFTPSTQPLTNRLLKVLSHHGRDYKTFGENIILLLNRESETSLQLLILKLLYLLYTTPSTYEYFYTNDLYVLTDILVRNLLDLPPQALHPGAGPLKHTYLRVLHPLLANTQLHHPPHYKRDELRKALHVLGDTGSHFDAPDETTLRLVGRCLSIHWLQDAEVEADAGIDGPESPVLLTGEGTGPGSGAGGGIGAALVARRALGMGSNAEASESSLSVAEMATQKSKPGVTTPSRSRDADADADADAEAGGAALDVDSPFEDQ